MLKIYFKQTIALFKQNKLISTISVIGTALAVMMVMVQILVAHISDANMAPEINRDRMLYIKNQSKSSKDTSDYSTQSGTLMYESYKNYLSDLKTPELTSIILSDFGESAMLSIEGSEDVYPSGYCYTDDNYWKIMSFDFVEGKPYDKADYNAELKKTVITQSKAKELFGNQSAIGKTVNINFVPYTVIGVVKDVSPIFTFSQWDIFIPYTTMPNYKNSFCNLLILANNKKDFESIKKEVRNAEHKYNATDKDNNMTFWGPYDQAAQKENIWSNIGVDEDMIPKRFFFIFIILLIVPAINLSSFSMSQIKKRTEEIGIRKAFGATQWSIVKQVLVENFITSLIGGLIGLVFSAFVLHFLRNWLLDIPDNGSIPVQSFISPYIFVAVFAVCLILNVLSAGIPAIRTVRMTIVDSLNRK